MSVIPDGHVLAPATTVWLEVEGFLAPARRKDWRRNFFRLGEQLALNCTAERITRKGLTWDGLIEATGLSRSTMADRLADHRELGLLATVTPGSTEETRLGKRGAKFNPDGLGNLAAEYALIVPVTALVALYGENWERDLAPLTAAEEDCRHRSSAWRQAPGPQPYEEVPWPCPTVPHRPQQEVAKALAKGTVDETRTPALGGFSFHTEPDHRAGTRTRVEPIAQPSFPLHSSPSTKAERVAAAERLIFESPFWGVLSPRDVGRILKPIFDLGGTVADGGHVLEFHPVYGQRPHPTTIEKHKERRSVFNWRTRQNRARLRGLAERRVAEWFRVADWADGTLELAAELPSQLRARAEAERRARSWAAERERQRAAIERDTAQPDPRPTSAPAVPRRLPREVAAVRQVLKELAPPAEQIRWGQHMSASEQRALQRARRERRERSKAAATAAGDAP